MKTERKWSRSRAVDTRRYACLHASVSNNSHVCLQIPKQNARLYRLDPQPNFFLYSAGWRTFSADFRLAAFFPADFRPAIFFRRIRLKFGGWGQLQLIRAIFTTKTPCSLVGHATARMRQRQKFSYLYEKLQMALADWYSISGMHEIKIRQLNQKVN